MIARILDSRYVRSLPNIKIHGFVVNRCGWNFRPNWDKSLAQPWFGRWWLWLGPYIIGWPGEM